METTVATRLQATDKLKVLSYLSLSCTPIWFLLQLRDRFSIDNLHITLFELLFLFLFNSFLQTKATRGVTPSKVSVTETVGGPTNVLKNDTKTLSKRGKARKIQMLYPPAFLDETLYRFITITVPAARDLFQQSVSPSKCTYEPIELKDWNLVYRSEEENDLVVLEHPTKKALFAICVTYSEVSMPKLMMGIRNVKRRAEWDGICASADTLEEYRPPLSKGRLATVAHLKMKGMAVIKPKDVVMLTSIATLPPGTKSIYPDDKGKSDGLKLVVAATSVEHPRAPEDRAFNRMKLDVSGFIVEDYGEKAQGSRLIQLTDLSGLGSWVPSSVVKTIVTKMIPKSLSKLGRLSATMPDPDPTESRYLPEIGDWLKKSEEGEKEEKEEVEVEEEEPEDVPESDLSGNSSLTSTPPNSFNLRNLISQLRSVTARLEVLESSKPSTSSPSASWVSALKYKMGTMTSGEESVGLVGFASGAASVASVAALWWVLGERKRRRGKLL